MVQMTQQDGFARLLGRQLEEMEKLGIPTARLRKQMEELGAVPLAHRILTGRRCSDGFMELKRKGQLRLSLEALVLDSRFGSLFSDEEANEALNRLMEAGYWQGRVLQ